MCGFEQEAALLEKMSPQAHISSAQQPIILLCVSLLHHLRRKNLIMSLNFHSFVRGFDRSNHFVSLQALHFCKAYLLHEHCFVVMRCQHWKIPFYSQQVVKRKRVNVDINGFSMTALLWCSLFTGKKAKRDI